MERGKGASKSKDSLNACLKVSEALPLSSVGTAYIMPIGGMIWGRGEPQGGEEGRRGGGGKSKLTQSGSVHSSCSCANA